MAQVTWKELVGARVREAMGISARARDLIADVLLDLKRSPELVAADAQSLPSRAQRAEGMLDQASRLLEEAASIMAAASHIAAAAIQQASPAAADDEDEVRRLRSGLAQLQDARARAEEASCLAEVSRNDLSAVGVLVCIPCIHLLDRFSRALQLWSASAMRCLEAARKLELESASLASKAADCLS